MAKQKEDEDRKRAEEERLRRQAKEKQEQEEAQRMIQESARAPSPVPAASPSPTPPVQPAAATYQVSPAALAGTLLKEEEVAEKAGSDLPSTRGGQTCPFCLCAEIRTAGCCRGERRTSVRGGVGETFHRAGGSVSDS